MQLHSGLPREAPGRDPREGKEVTDEVLELYERELRKVPVINRVLEPQYRSLATTPKQAKHCLRSRGERPLGRAECLLLNVNRVASEAL
jgi:hypothetical protein